MPIGMQSRADCADFAGQPRISGRPTPGPGGRSMHSAYCTRVGENATHAGGTTMAKRASGSGRAEKGPNLQKLRDQIDKIDGQLLELFNERAKLAQEIGRVKDASGSDVFAPAREVEILAR